MSGNGETFCSGRQFLISYKGVNRVVDNVLIQRLVLYFRNLHLFHSNTIKTGNFLVRSSFQTND